MRASTSASRIAFQARSENQPSESCGHVTGGSSPVPPLAPPAQQQAPAGPGCTSRPSAPCGCGSRALTALAESCQPLARRDPTPPAMLGDDTPETNIPCSVVAGVRGPRTGSEDAAGQPRRARICPRRLAVQPTRYRGPASKEPCRLSVTPLRSPKPDVARRSAAPHSHRRKLITRCLNLLAPIRAMPHTLTMPCFPGTGHPPRRGGEEGASGAKSRRHPISRWSQVKPAGRGRLRPSEPPSPHGPAGQTFLKAEGRRFDPAPDHHHL